MKTIFYGDPAPKAPIPNSIFLAGCSVSPKAAERTEWRLDALAQLRAQNFEGTVIIPEFESGGFRREPFDDGQPATIPGLSRASEKIIAWESAGLDHAGVILAWMPFALAAETSPNSLPGFSTRAEVIRAITMDHPRLALGMPAGALAGGQIRYHAAKSGYRIYDNLGVTVSRAVELLQVPLIDKDRRVELGIDGDHAFALLGDDIQSGEVEFIWLPDQGLNTQLVFCKKAFRQLKARLNRPELSYFFGPSHPYGQ